MIQSFGHDRVTGNMVLVLDSGQSVELWRCPFSNCNLYHSTRMAVCPTTGKSIAAERTRQRKTKEAGLKASRAEKDYQQEHLRGWRNKWRGWLGVAGAMAIFAFWSLSFEGGERIASAIILSFTWAFVWSSAQAAANRRVYQRAQEVYEQVLEEERERGEA